MALKKQITTPEGVNADYWKIAQTHIDHLNGKMEVWVYPYVNQQARMDGMKPLTDQRIAVSFPFAQSDFQQAKDIVNLAYNKAKSNKASHQPQDEETPFFFDAEDV